MNVSSIHEVVEIYYRIISIDLFNIDFITSFKSPLYCVLFSCSKLYLLAMCLLGNLLGFTFFFYTFEFYNVVKMI